MEITAILEAWRGTFMSQKSMTLQQAFERQSVVRGLLEARTLFLTAAGAKNLEVFQNSPGYSRRAILRAFDVAIKEARTNG